MGHTVTISATYGAAGSVIGPALAERLGLPFFDRLLHDPATSAERLLERLSEEERVETPPGPVASLAHVSSGLGFPIPRRRRSPPACEALRARHRGERGADRRIGRRHPRAGWSRRADRRSRRVFHVRLDGPVERRIRAGMRIEGVSEAVAREHQTTADREWSKFGQRVFKRDFRDVPASFTSCSTPRPSIRRRRGGFAGRCGTRHWKHEPAR